LSNTKRARTFSWSEVALIEQALISYRDELDNFHVRTALTRRTREEVQALWGKVSTFMDVYMDKLDGSPALASLQDENLFNEVAHLAAEIWEKENEE
jgi:hypothetical protein